MNKNNTYRAFGNEQRVNLLKCLSKPKNVTEMLEYCTLTQSALSQHLKVLRKAELVKTRREGKEVVYEVRNKEVSKIINLLLNFK